MTIKDKFDEWFASNATEFSFICEQFYSDCELNDVELRKTLLKGWLQASFQAGYDVFLEEAIRKVLYGDIEEEPYSTIKDHCKLNKNGDIDYHYIDSLDEEQQVRLSIAATLRGMKE